MRRSAIYRKERPSTRCASSVTNTAASRWISRNANGGGSSGPVEVDRPWDAYADDQLGLMDHLGIDKFLVLGFCIGGPFIWKMLERAPERVIAAVPAMPSGFRPEVPDLFYRNNMKNWAPALCESRLDVTMETCSAFLKKMYLEEQRLRVQRDARFRTWVHDAGACHAG